MLEAKRGIPRRRRGRRADDPACQKTAYNDVLAKAIIPERKTGAHDERTMRCQVMG
jgi:hypothetical protein